MIAQGYESSVISFLSSRKCKKQPPHGFVLIIPVDKLLEHDHTYIKILSQKNKERYRATVFTLTS